jgi:cytoskeletal protein RodZ
MEEEKFEVLPEEIYLKTHLKNIAACLDLKPGKVVDDYLGRFREWKRTK